MIRCPCIHGCLDHSIRKGHSISTGMMTSLYASGGSRGATGGHGPPKRFKIFFFTPLNKEFKKFCYVTLVFKELRLLDYTPALEIGPENFVNYPPPLEFFGTQSTTPPLEIGPENSGQLPPPSNSRNPSTTPPPSKSGRKTPSTTPPSKYYGGTEIRPPQIQFLDPPLLYAVTS